MNESKENVAVSANGSAGMPILEINDLGVRYDKQGGTGTIAVEEVSFSVNAGEFVSIIGPSGCGKSTVLHCLGGMLAPTSGTVRYEGKPLTRPDPSKAAFVFQDYSLFPWKNVLDNAAAGLRFAGTDRHERRKRAMDKLEMVGLADRAHAFPAELSGGMQQRVAVARALAMEPQILLMDEPFGALDEQTRRSLGIELAETLAATGKTLIMVTHSLDEAIFWADRVIVMSKSPGRIRTVIDVNEPRPRRPEFMTEPRFDGLRTRLFELLDVSPKGARAAG